MLSNNNLEFSVENDIYDEVVIYIILDCTIEEQKFILANIYSPNSYSHILIFIH